MLLYIKRTLVYCRLSDGLSDLLTLRKQIQAHKTAFITISITISHYIQQINSIS